MTGPELADRMKTLRPEMQVVFMSGYSENTLLDRRMLGTAVRLYLAKPFSPPALAARIRDVFGPSPASGTILLAEGDPASRSLFREALESGGYRVHRGSRTPPRRFGTSRHAPSIY